MEILIRLGLGLILITALPGASLAKEPPSGGVCSVSREFLSDGAKLRVCWADSFSGWVSAPCLDRGKGGCGALSLLRRAERKDVTLFETDLKGGKNPGSVLCAKLGAKVVIASDPSGNRASFCEAADKTLIDCNSLASGFYKVGWRNR